MRDLGSLGEHTFCVWCAGSGLIQNGSRIDKTGWDFFVEFPFISEKSNDEMHIPAIECKVQVKATDSKKRKHSISLSNLRRLITAQMPAFYIFIEFDGCEKAQRAFVVHIDNELIYKVLQRLHTVIQSEGDHRFNKRTMTINYDDSHMMASLDGNCLKNLFLKYIGSNLPEYISNKNKYLQSTGYEDGFAQINFSTTGEENLAKLIDVSLGIEKEVQISHFKGTKTRFGIISRTPFVDENSGKLLMPDLKPSSEGIVRFKEGNLSPGISFPAKLYISPFNAMVPEKFRKIRVEGEFFDLKFNPFTGEANYFLNP